MYSRISVLPRPGRYSVHLSLHFAWRDLDALQCKSRLLSSTTYILSPQEDEGLARERSTLSSVLSLTSLLTLSVKMVKRAATGSAGLDRSPKRTQLIDLVSDSESELPDLDFSRLSYLSQKVRKCNEGDSVTLGHS